MTFLNKVISVLFLLQLSLFTQEKELAFEDIFTGREFNEVTLSGVMWMPGEDKFSFLKYDPASVSYNIYQHDITTGEESVIISGNDLIPGEAKEPIRIQNYYWSPDGKYALFTGLIHARSVKSGGTFYLYNMNSKKITVITGSDQKQVNAAISPDSRKLGFVRGNNLFVTDIESGKETQLTFDGDRNILNGVFDWVYEEEFKIIMGWQWSPDSKSIAYWRLDQSNVPELTIAKWDSLYMQPLKMKYPKPGGANSLVQIGVVNISNSKTIWMDTGKETDIYIPRIMYSKDPGLLAIQRLNRLQNKLELLFADTKTGTVKVVITETSDAWLRVVDELIFTDDGSRFTWSSERDGFKHLYLYDLNGKIITQLTKGKWEVKSLAGTDNINIFFTANERGKIFSDLYSVNFDGTDLKRITEDAGTHLINLSADKKYFIDIYSNAGKLPVTSIFTAGGKKIRDIIEPDMSFWKEYNFVPVEFITFATSDGAELNASIMKPHDYVPQKKYPVLFDVYGGPGSEGLVNKWGGFNHLWNQYLIKQGYIIFKLDNRGTGGRGTAFRNIVYKDLGSWEVNDMVEGAKFLIKEGIADSTKIGIWGWSYGGYTAAITIMNAADYFKTAIAVAPVTHWQYYDNIYTERFMQTPELNPEGYKESSPITHAGKLKGKLLLMHGTADDNVHFQNTVALAEKLIELNKQFEIMFYPEKNHSIRGGSTRQHLYRKIFEFLKANL